MKSTNKTGSLTIIALLAAIVAVLQLLGGFIRFGPFNISLVLVPIVLGAALYGKKTGAFLGAVFGAVVVINCITGMDQGGLILFNANPAVTVFMCLFKGAAAGFAAGAVYAGISKRDKYIGALCAAIVCPVINTFIFLALMFLFYQDILIEWAGDTPVFYYLLIGLAGVNFLLEVTVNIALSPAVANIVSIRKSATQ